MDELVAVDGAAAEAEAPVGPTPEPVPAPPIEAPPGAGPAHEVDDRAEGWERQAETLGSSPTAALLLCRAARVREVRRESAGALALYQRAVAVSPGFRPALEGALRLALAGGDVALACQLLDRAAPARSPRDEAALGLLRARLREERAGDAARARADLAAAAAAAPDDLGLVDHQAALAAQEERWEDLSRALERCATLADDPALSGAWLAAAAALEEDRLGRSERAADLAVRAFAASPGDPGVRALARAHAERAARHADLRPILVAEATSEMTPPREAALAWCAVARLELEHLRRPEEAAAALERARDLAEADPIVLDAVASLHEARGAWEQAAEILRLRAAALVQGAPADTSELVAENLRLAELCQEKLDRPGEAAACYRAVLALAPGHRGALAALGRIHAAAGDWPQLLETFMAERAAATDPRDRAQRCFKAGELLQERLDRLPEAVDLYREALGLDPELLAAHQALERVYERSGRHADLAALLEAGLERLRDPGERVALLFRIARLQEDALQDAGAAAAAYERILALAPEHGVALRALAAAHERAGRHPAQVEILERLARLTPEPRQAVTYLQRAAEVTEDHLADPAAAAVAWGRVLALAPGHQPALRALGRLHAAAGRWAELAAMCRAEAEVAPSPEAAAQQLARAAEIAERRLGQEAEAIATYHEVLTLWPSHGGALRALQRLHARRGEHQRLLEVLLTDAAACPAPERQAALLAQAAALCEEQLADPSRAAELHADALRRSPGHTASQRALARLLSTSGRWAELAALLEAQAERAAGPARAAILVEVARVSLERLGDPARAEAACRGALAVAPGLAAALVLLSRLPGARGEARAALAARLPDRHGAAQLLVAAALDGAAAGQDPLARRPEIARAASLEPSHPVAAALVREALEGAADPLELARNHEARRAHEPDPAGQALWALEAAEAFELAGELHLAVARHEEALALCPGALPALEKLAELHARREDWARARTAERALGDALRDPARAARAFVRAAAIARDRLGDPAEAIGDLRRALDRAPRDEEALSRAVALLEAAGRQLEASDLLAARAGLEADGPARAARFLAAARQALAAGAPERAVPSLDAALEAQPNAPEILRLRGRTLAGLGRAFEAARDLAQCLTTAPCADGAALHVELATLYDGALGDRARAASHLAAALAAAPDLPEALEAQVRVQRGLGNWPAAADALRRLAASPAVSTPRRQEILVELSELREASGDPASAAALVERAIALGPGDPALADRLTRLRDRAHRHPAVVAALEGAAKALPAGQERARAHLRAAHVLGTMLDDGRRAILELRRALEIDPGNAEARAALTELYATHEPALAVDEHRHDLAQDPARVESWRALFEVFRASKAYDRAFVVAQVLRFLRASDPATDGAYHAQNAATAPVSTSLALTPAEWLSMRHPGDRGALTELLAVAGDALAEAVELPPAPRERARGPHPLSELASGISAVLGIEPLVLRPGGEGSAVQAEPGPARVVRVGSEVLRRLGPAEHRFLLGRAAARVRAHGAVAGLLLPEELGRIVAAVVQQVVPGYAMTGTPPERLVRAVGRALSRKQRRQLEGPARAVAATPNVNVAAWQAATAATADRVGLLLACDAAAALSLVAALEGAGPASAPEVAAAIRARPELRQLLLFSVSDEHFRLRQRLRLALA